MTLIARQMPHTKIQSVLLSRRAFRTQRLAKAWLELHGFRRELDVKPRTYRARQIDPSHFARGSFRTIQLTAGVEAVIGHLKVRGRR